jgi:hypothetical protein
MAWQHRLPDGMRHEGSSSQGFTLSVSLPIGQDGLAPLQCPADTGHRFKVTLTQSPSGQSSDCYCPYCGTRAAIDEFLADQLPRLNAAMEAAAEQYAHQALDDILSKVFAELAVGTRFTLDGLSIARGSSRQAGRCGWMASEPTPVRSPGRRGRWGSTPRSAARS